MEQPSIFEAFEQERSERHRHRAVDALPELLGQVVEISGEEAAIRLADRYGGTRMYVPSREHLDERHPLVVLVGKEAAEAISERWAGLHLEVPLGSDVTRLLRNLEIKRMSDSHRSAGSIARRFGMTRRSVLRILAEGR